jgi:hypothetical protein
MKSRVRVFSVLLAVTALITTVSVILPNAWALKSANAISGNSPINRAAASTASDDDSLILLNSAEINVRSAESKAERKLVSGFEGKRMHQVRFTGPIQPQWHKMLVEKGLEIVDYIPNYTYIVYGDSNAINGLQSNSLDANSSIEWEGVYKDQYRILPDVHTSKDKDGVRNLASEQFQVQLYKDNATNSETISSRPVDDTRSMFIHACDENSFAVAPITDDQGKSIMKVLRASETEFPLSSD